MAQVTDKDVEDYLARRQARRPAGTCNRGGHKSPWPIFNEVPAQALPAKSESEAWQDRTRELSGPCRSLMSGGLLADGWRLEDTGRGLLASPAVKATPSPPEPERPREIPPEPRTGPKPRALSHQRRKAEGLCVSCLDPRDSPKSRVYCGKCHAQRLRWRRARSAKARATGP